MSAPYGRKPPLWKPSLPFDKPFLPFFRSLNFFVPKGQRSLELMMLDNSHASQPWEGGRGAPLCGPAWSAAASPSAPLLPLARTGAVAAPPAWVGALELSETVLDESAVPSYGAHAALAAHQALPSAESHDDGDTCDSLYEYHGLSGYGMVPKEMQWCDDRNGLNTELC